LSAQILNLKVKGVITRPVMTESAFSAVFPRVRDHQQVRLLAWSDMDRLGPKGRRLRRDSFRDTAMFQVSKLDELSTTPMT
jgi:hypothetical protein